MDFKNKISELKSIQKQCEKDGESINSKIQNELTIVQNQIVTKYDDDIKESYKKLQNVDSELANLYRLVELCSVFDEKVITKVISELVSSFEGVEYIYQYTRNYTKVNINSSKYLVDKRPKIIISQNHKRDFYCNDTNADLSELVKCGHALILVDDAIGLQHVIQFYRFNECKMDIKSLVDFGKFEYVKEFIDSLISYKIEKKMVSVSNETINMLKLKFICFKSNEIRKKYELRDRIKE